MASAGSTALRELLKRPGARRLVASLVRALRAQVRVLDIDGSSVLDQVLPRDHQALEPCAIQSGGEIVGYVCGNGALEVAECISGIFAIEAEKQALEQALLARSAQLEATELELVAANEALDRLSYVDRLTGVCNRRSFDRALLSEWERSRRGGQALAVLMVDVDAFAAYNKLYGRDVGDECLNHIGRALGRALRRATDFLARYGGDEFALVLPNTDAAGAEVLADELVAAVRQLGLPHRDGPAGIVSISIGIASCIPALGGTPAKLLERAEQGVGAAGSGAHQGFARVLAP